MSDKAEQQAQTHNDSTTTQKDNFTKEALRLYECYPGGPVVADPADCREKVTTLPELSLIDTKKSTHQKA